MFNLLVQLLVGLPLEMVHGSGRIAAVYLAGVLAGNVYLSLVDSIRLTVGHLIHVFLSVRQVES
jgi:rhomboid-related protein 1/2/3